MRRRKRRRGKSGRRTSIWVRLAQAGAIFAPNQIRTDSIELRWKRRSEGVRSWDVPIPLLGRADRPQQPRAAACAVGAVVERKSAAVPLRDLSAQNQSSAGSVRFGRVERNEQVGVVGQARALIFNTDLPPSSPRGP